VPDTGRHRVKPPAVKRGVSGRKLSEAKGEKAPRPLIDILFLPLQQPEVGQANIFDDMNRV